MSLWTPYDPEQVLDLSKAAAAVKMERASPIRTSPTVAASVHEAYMHHGHYQQYCDSPMLSPSSSHHSHRSLYSDCSPPASSPESASERVSSSTKFPRPFKAVTAVLPECGAAVDPDPNYASFRSAMLEAMRARNGGSLSVSNPRMRRAVRRNSEVAEDADYLQRRARNNAAAKRSRDLRKQKEDELAIRVAFLEKQNADLRDELVAASGRPCPRCVPYY